jgi:hypothetical protein
LATADIHLLPQRADAADLVMPSKFTGILASARSVVATVHPDTPVLIKALNATMQPFKFMEFSMEAQIQVTLLAQRGPITVNAPPPEKYALHKLLVYGERLQNMRIRASKDLDQAASLVAYLAERDAELLEVTWLGLLSQGPGSKSRAMQGLVAPRQRFPDLDVSALRTDGG